MKTQIRSLIFASAVWLGFAPGLLQAANVPPSGYTNSFEARPSADDWATTNKAGASNVSYDMDTEANAFVTVTNFPGQVLSSTGNPPGILAGAVWSSTGRYLQTRPASSQYVMLLGKFVNDTGTNATQVTVSYVLNFAGNPALEDVGMGTRAYYSFTGRTGSWVNIPEFNTTATNGTTNLTANLAINWLYGSNLFLLWIDDNAVPTSDVANQIDNFSISVSGGEPPKVIGLLDSPVNNAVYYTDQSVTNVVSVFNGTPPYVVQFYTNSGAGNTVFQPAGTVTTAPYRLNMGLLPPGRYNVYATVTDENGGGFTTNTVTNTFSVVNALVNLTSPTNNQITAVGGPFQLSATASVGPSYSVTSVEFFVNGLSAGFDSNAPYALIIPSQPEGFYSVYAAVLDSLGRTTYTATNTLQFAVNPLANDNFVNRFLLATPSTVFGTNVNATLEGGEPNFQFGGGLPFITWGATLWYKWVAPFDGLVIIDTFGSGINTVLSAYTGTAVGSLTLITRNDNADAGTTASRISFVAVAGTEYQIQLAGQGGGFGGGQAAQGALQLNLTMPPVVSITSPTAGAAFLVGSNISVTVSATAAVGSVTNVSLFRGNTLVGSLTAPPYIFSVSNSPVGSNSFVAVATDSIGQAGTSAAVPVLVANIGITITAPVDNSLYLNPSSIALAAYTALPGGGSITNVSFFVDGALIGDDTSAPFSVTWSNITGGSHRLTASGFDDSGNPYDAIPVFIGVGENLVPFGSTWKYLADGSNQSNAWYGVNYDDSAWLIGAAELGYGDGDEATVVPSGPAGNFFITTYFRRSFAVSNIAAISDLILWLEYDDGGAVYLNGQPLYRTANLPANAGYNTVTTGGAGEDTTDALFVTVSNLVEGNNIIAAEIHQQAPDSSDISFNLQLASLPVINRNQFPEVALTSPANNAAFGAPASINLAATASDADGSVTNVEFFADGVKVGEDSSSPYSANWAGPSVGLHSLYAVATDNLGGSTRSATIRISVHNAGGTPLARIDSPANNTVAEGPTNMLVTATAAALDAVVNVEFFANGVLFGNDSSIPYSAVWTAPFGAAQLTAVAIGANGKRGTSEVVNVTITIPPTNTVPPTVAGQLPPAFTVVTNANFTNITVVFSERVQNVDAADLLINGVPATSVSGTGSNYVFGFARPPFGNVEVAFAPGHGITDFGYPAPLPYDNQDGSGFWQLEYDDVVPPVVAVRVPAQGALVTNLSSISVTFSEAVTGVDASDLLVNNTAAFAVVGSGSNYTFSVGQPPSGTVNVTWSLDHGITDLGVSGPPIAFNRTGTGATWSFTLDSRTTLIASNSQWRLFKGLTEASDPTNAWRQLAYDDSTWSNSFAPFVFGEPSFTNATIPGTSVADMANNAYSSIFLRQQFVIEKASAITNLLLNHQTDDGFIAWINGVEAFRFNMPTGHIAFNGGASVQATEAGGNGGAQYTVANLNNGLPALVTGTNVLAIHAFNVVSTPASSDFAFNAHLYSHIPDFGVVPPRIASVVPAQGEVFYLTNLTVTFTEPVANVHAGDLLVNGVAATGLASSTNTEYTFSFAQPVYGTVLVTWVVNHGIVDFDSTPKPFDGTIASSRFTFNLLNPSAPSIVTQTPVGGTTITGLTSIAVRFSEPVTGVDAADLRINNVAATGVSGSGSNYTFTVTQPAYGSVAVRWLTNHGIQDVEGGNAFDPSRPGNTWNYTLVNPVPTVTMTSPTNNAYMLAPANIPFRVNAVDNDGTIVRVEYYDRSEGGTLAEVTNAPFSFTWSNVSFGTYSFHAIATDNSGLRATSAPLVFNVVAEIPPLLTRGPYLQVGSPTGGVVRWRTDRAAGSLVRLGTSPGALNMFVPGTNNVTEHIVRFGGLQPDTKYYYSIGSSNQTLAAGPDHWFITSPVHGTPKPTRIWVLGDAGTANNNQRAVRDAYYNLAAAERPADLWLMLGDNAYNTGTDQEHQAAVFDMYPDTLRNHFLWPVLGNHESAQSFTALTFPYLDIFTLPTQGEAGGVPSGNPKYYSFDYGNIHFVGLDSMTSTRSGTSPMAQWLRNDLSSTTQRWIIVYFHHPPYTKGSHNSDTESDLVELRQNLLPILEEYSVDLVMSGHSHCLERSFLLHGHYGLSTTINPAMLIDSGDGREDGTGAYRKNALGQGVVYMVAGSSGQISGGQLNHPGHYRSLNLLGSVVIDVDGDRLDSRFVTSTGAIEDHFTLLKSPLGILVVESIEAAGTNVVVSFEAYANTTYTLEQSSQLGPWQAVTTITKAPTNRWIQITRPAEDAKRFFRLRSP